MKKLVLALSFICAFSSAHAAKFDDVPWEEIVGNFASLHKSPMESQEKRQEVVRVFARSVYEGVQDADYQALPRITIALDRDARSKITLTRGDGEEFIEAMHRHFAAELAGFKPEDEGMYRFPGVYLNHLMPKQL